METDDEQVEKLKKWWEENGRSVIAGVIIGVGGLFGYRYWIDLQEATAEAASAQFVQMMEALKSSDNAAVTERAELLISEYADTEYATLARFALARNLVDKGNYDQAQTQLEQIIGTVGDAPLGYLARKRLASVQLELAQLDQALVTLSVKFPSAFGAGVDELRGDIYAQQGKIDEAADAYREALSAIPGPANSEFLQQKLDDLGVTG
jgi:predicted negative regulator of RcsB-dependent stress response